MYGKQGSRRWRLPVTIGAAVVAMAGGGLGVALAAENGGGAASATIVCPDVRGQLPAVPARAQAEVERNLALLDTQIGEANKRLARSAGEGGPNFVQNAILGPLEDKRISTIDRIAIAIGRVAARPQGLNALAPCALSTSAGQNPPAVSSASPPRAQPAAGAISCPDVRSQLPAIPARAQAEVDRNLALLDKQISEADARLARSAGEGGPNFVQNAILGPLTDKRVSTIDRIAIAIGRGGVKPVGLGRLAACRLADK